MKLRAKKTGKGTRYYLQTTVTLEGRRKQKEFPMGSDKKTANSKAKRFLVTLEESGLDAAQEELKGGSPLKKGHSPTAKQLEKLYKEFQKHTTQPIKEKTVYDNVGSLKRIFKAFKAQTLNQVDPNKLRKMMLGDSPTESQRRGFAATISQAKSLFKPACLKFYESKGVKLANIFDGVELNAPQIKPYTPMNRKGLESAMKDLPILPSCEQIIFLLCYYFGLRRIEAEHCRMEWFTDDGEKVFLSIQATDHFKPKTNEGRVFPVSREIYERIVALRNSLNPKDSFTAYVESDTPTARLDRRFKILTTYLRNHGFAGGRPIQQLRKECGSRIVTETKSIYEAQRVLGHSSPTVTAKHYASLLNLSTVGETVVEESPEEKLAKSIGITVEELRKRLGI